MLWIFINLENFVPEHLSFVSFRFGVTLTIIIQKRRDFLLLLLFCVFSAVSVFGLVKLGSIVPVLLLCINDNNIIQELTFLFILCVNGRLNIF